MTTWFSATAALPQLVDLWSLSGSASAWLTIAVQIGFVVGAVTSAALTLSDILPPRRMILLGAVGAATANALLYFAANQPSTTVSLAAGGLEKTTFSVNAQGRQSNATTTLTWRLSLTIKRIGHR